MPELAEVEYYRSQWNAGIGLPVQEVKLHATKRIFRGLKIAGLKRGLSGSMLLRSEAHGKQMLFRFSNDSWLGLHLGMTGELRVEKPSYQPGKHDHLVLYQKHQALVFSDPRQFGRVRFHLGASPPDWWSDLPAAVLSREFTPKLMTAFLHAHGGLPIKAALLLQQGFPGIGNWMADEILWRSGLHPGRLAAKLNGQDLQKLWRTLRFVCRAAMKSLEKGYSALPPGWLFHERWQSNGRCPRHGSLLLRKTIGGRTTVWCPDCQPFWIFKTSRLNSAKSALIFAPKSSR